MDNHTTVTIALVEDNIINRNTFLQKINQLKQYALSFVATNGNECLEELKGLPLPRHPQVIFMDLEMPELDGIQTIALAKDCTTVHFIVLTVFDDDERSLRPLKQVHPGICSSMKMQLNLKKPC